MAWIKKVYLYAVSLISLIILVIAAIMLINLGLKTWIFTKADQDIYYPQPMCAAASPPAIKSGTTDSMIYPSPCNVNNDYKKQQLDARNAQKQRDAAQALAMIIVATPVFLYHWKLARKES